MGSAASLSVPDEAIDVDAAKKLFGERFDQVKFDELKDGDGKIAPEQVAGLLGKDGPLDTEYADSAAFDRLGALRMTRVEEVKHLFDKYAMDGAWDREHFELLLRQGDPLLTDDEVETLFFKMDSDRSGARDESHTHAPYPLILRQGCSLPHVASTSS